MSERKLLKSVINNGKRMFMSSNIRNSTIDKTMNIKKLEHYRHLNALDTAPDAKPIGWDEAKPFETIPGPKPLPIVGNVWRFILPFGNFFKMDMIDVFELLRKQYGDITVLKGLLSRKPIVSIFNIKDIETLYRNEGVWPIREGSEAMKYYRKTRKDIFKSTGLLTIHGEEWFKFRSMVNPILMKPKNVLQYVDRMNVVADQLTENIKHFSEQNPEGEMPKDFNIELYKWSLESIGVVTMDTHLGCLNLSAKKDSEPFQLIQCVLQFFTLMYKLDVMPSFWKIISTPTWKQFVEILNFLSETNLKYVKQSLEKLDKEKTNVDDDTTNVLQKLIKMDRDLAIVMAIDMLIAGVDTTGRVLGNALYFLAKYPEAQKQLRNEATTLLEPKNTAISKETLAQAHFVKAVIKETLRLAPIGAGNLRTTVKNLVLGGYQIPAGTDVVTAHLMLCKMDEHFPKAAEFLPERWLSTTTGELSFKNTNLFVYAPFGQGPRSCVGRRLANLELEVALLKIIRNLELSWPHEDMVFETKLFYGMARPLKLHVRSTDN